MFLIRVQFATFATAIKLYITAGAGYSTRKPSFGYSPNDADENRFNWLYNLLSCNSIWTSLFPNRVTATSRGRAAELWRSLCVWRSGTHLPVWHRSRAGTPCASRRTPAPGTCPRRTRRRGSACWSTPAWRTAAPCTRCCSTGTPRCCSTRPSSTEPGTARTACGCWRCSAAARSCRGDTAHTAPAAMSLRRNGDTWGESPPAWSTWQKCPRASNRKIKHHSLLVPGSIMIAKKPALQWVYDSTHVTTFKQIFALEISKILASFQTLPCLS